MLIPLWLPENTSVDSPPFVVRPGEAALLVATGFERFRQRTNAREFRSPQTACVHRLIFDYEIEGVGALEPVSPCGPMLDITRVKTTVVEEPVWVDGCNWSIGACNNTRIIGVPGVYRLHMNDVTAVGTAQVWLEMHKFSDFAPQIEGIYF